MRKNPYTVELWLNSACPPRIRCDRGASRDAAKVLESRIASNSEDHLISLRFTLSKDTG